MSSASAGNPVPGLLPDALLTDLEVAWSERELEAGELFAKNYNSVGLALRLYALEIRLKTLICKHLKLSLLPKACKTHELSELVIFTGRWEELEDPANTIIRQNWDLLVDFSKKRLNNLRYIPRHKLPSPEFSKLMNALDDPNDGVLSWLLNHP
jgi:hypothetical protein